MSKEQHRLAAELFERLQGLPAADRDRELDAACGSDDALKEFVRGLLAADAEAPGGFLSGPAIETAAHWVDTSDALSGVRFGQYRLIRVIGAGGMGTVYEALDERLNRPVAVKVLPAEAVRDSDRLRRFQQEARAASLLNHPNIVSVYDAAEDGGRHYLATELVKGKTLRELIDEGPVDGKLVLEIGSQVASALEAAHQAGIVHRDIKPENVMLRPDGFVKVLDFGLAKLREVASGERLDLTRPGQVAGTLRYLSPEQVLGKPVGPRSDIFSLGVLLYELSTGVRPFDGPTDGAVFDAISNRAPVPPGNYRPELRPSGESVILRALEKDPDLRFQTAGDFRAACRQASRGSQEIPLPPPVRKRWLGPLLAAGVVTAALVLWLTRPAPAPRLPVRFDVLATGTTEPLFPNLTPDGRQFVYAAQHEGQWDIFLQRTGGTTAVSVTKDSTADDTEPALSADGTALAFRSERAGGGLYVSELTGENPRRVASRGYLPAWSPDGRRLVYSTVTFSTPGVRGPVSRLVVLDLATGQERELPTGMDAIQPHWSPHGHRIAYWSNNTKSQRDIFTIAAGPSPGEPVRVTNDEARDWNPVWSPAGDELYFLSDRGGTMNVWRVAIDERTGRVSSAPAPVTVPASKVLHLRPASSGQSFIFANVDESTNLYSLGFDATRAAITTEYPEAAGGPDPPSMFNFSFARDGKWLVHDTVGAAQEDIWVTNIEGTQRRRLTEDAAMDRMPVWSPVNDEILYFSGASGRLEIWVIHADGSGRRRVTDSGPLQRSLWSPDGERILSSSAYPGPPQFYSARQPTPVGRQSPPPGVPVDRPLYFWDWRPDGAVLSIIENAQRQDEIMIYHQPEGRLEATGVLGRSPAWLPGGRQFAFVREGNCYVYDLGRRSERLLFSVTPQVIYKVDFSQPGRVYFTQTRRRSQLWLGRW